MKTSREINDEDFLTQSPKEIPGLRGLRKAVDKARLSMKDANMTNDLKPELRPVNRQTDQEDDAEKVTNKIPESDDV